jgi:carboxypeptidase family protein/TonB-dependent receptor-like protein
MRRVSMMAALGCFLALGSFFEGTAGAQALGTLEGKILDESQAPLPGVSVKITNVQTGAVRNAVTDADGLYRAPSLQPGVYSIEASLQGLQSVKQDNIKLLVGQVLDINLKMSVQTVAEAITVTAEAPVVEVSRSSAAKYIGEEEIANIPISGRDFVDFALLAPTVKSEPDRGGISLSGQRGVNSGLKLDGTEGKSAFFGYGRGGEATENEGTVVAQDSVKEFQVITNGFAPEFGQNGGGYVNVVTKSGTNDLKGTGFFLFRNQSLVSDLPLSPYDEAKGNECKPAGTVNCAPNEFKRTNWGASLGGPIIEDKTHFFLSYDQLTRTEPRDALITIPGVFDAVEARFPGLLRGYEPQADGTARAQFSRDVDNLILFGKIDHQLTADNTLSVRYNYTNYSFATPDPQAESSKPEKTNAAVASLVSVLGNNAVNEFRFQYATDNFSRRSDFERDLNPPTPAQLDFIIGGNSVSLGKAYFFPIFTDETKIQFQDNLSYMFGDHDLKFGFDFQSDNASQYFAGFADGRYEFRSLDSFITNTPTRVRIFYGDVNNPNFDETQSVMGVYAQDNWKPSSKLTLNFGVRWDGTFNPHGIKHLIDGTVPLPDGSTPNAGDIPNDLNNFAPRLGFAYSLSDDGKDVLRGGAGLFYSRTPILLWAAIVTSNGLVPGVVSAAPGQPGFVPLGDTIDNNAQVPGTINLALADANFQDPQTWRFNLGYEREVLPNWSVGVDLIYARGDNLQSNNDLNRELNASTPHDQYGRPLYNRTRPDPAFGQVFVRSSPAWSNYYAGTLNLNKRWADHFQLQASYTYSVDKDSDDSERTATTVTITDISDPGFDYGTSSRDIRHRFVLSGVAELPLDIKLSGVAFFQSGRPYTIADANSTVYGDPNGFVDEVARGVVNGQLVDRNSERNAAFKKIDLRLSKFFDVDRFRIEGFAEVFNLFNTVTFDVNQIGNEAIAINRDGTPNPNFGLARVKNVNSDQRQIQLGARVSF